MQRTPPAHITLDATDPFDSDASTVDDDPLIDSAACTASASSRWAAHPAEPA